VHFGSWRSGTVKLKTQESRPRTGVGIKVTLHAWIFNCW